MPMEGKERRRLWKERVEVFLASGQNQRAWCQEHGLPAHQLGYWLRKFKDEAREACRPTMIVGLAYRAPPLSVRGFLYALGIL